MRHKNLFIFGLILVVAILAARILMPDPFTAFLDALLEYIKAFGAYANRFSPWS